MERFEAGLVATLNTRAHLLLANIARLEFGLAKSESIVVRDLPASTASLALSQRLVRALETSYSLTRLQEST
jgi:hypothetical protein